MPLDCGLLRRVFGVLREAGWSYRGAALVAAMYEFQRSRPTVYCINIEYVADHLARCGLRPLTRKEVEKAMDTLEKRGIAFRKPRYGDKLYLCLNKQGLALIDEVLSQAAYV